VLHFVVADQTSKHLQQVGDNFNESYRNPALKLFVCSERPQDTKELDFAENRIQELSEIIKKKSNIRHCHQVLLHVSYQICGKQVSIYSQGR